MSQVDHMRFAAVLGNVNKSILQVHLGDGFIIEEWPMGKFIAFFELIHGSATHDIEFKINEDWGYWNDRKSAPKSIYLVTKNVVDYPEQISSPSSPGWHEQFENRFRYERKIENQLNDKISKLRLCASGSIKVCAQIYYHGEGNKIELQSSVEEGVHGENRIFKIRKSILPDLQKLLQGPPLSGCQKYIRFAIDNYNQAYRVIQMHLEFISLMLALEALFNDGKQELRNKVARGCAVLLGRNIIDSRRIFKTIRDLYDKRSVLVHTGDLAKIQNVDIELLHNFVRLSLGRAAALNLPKEAFSALLLEAGFGQGPSISRKSPHYCDAP